MKDNENVETRRRPSVTDQVYGGFVKNVGNIFQAEPRNTGTPSTAKNQLLNFKCPCMYVCE